MTILVCIKKENKILTDSAVFDMENHSKTNGYQKCHIRQYKHNSIKYAYCGDTMLKDLYEDVLNPLFDGDKLTNLDILLEIPKLFGELVPSLPHIVDTVANAFYIINGEAYTLKTKVNNATFIQFSIEKTCQDVSFLGSGFKFVQGAYQALKDCNSADVKDSELARRAIKSISKIHYFINDDVHAV